MIIVTDDIPATLEKLEAEMESFKANIKEWEKTRDEKKAKILAGEPLDEDDAKDEPDTAAAAEGDDA